MKKIYSADKKNNTVSQSEQAINNKYSSSIDVRVYYEDTDSGGVVYYANYLKFIERGRSEYLRQLGFEQDDLVADKGIIFAVKSLSADYLSPAKFNEKLQVKTYALKTNKASIVFLHKIVNSEQNKVLFKAQVLVACLSAKNFKPCALPLEILEKING
jgi:acyl-CoA thioester hydrolase|tara:strand:+ start:302 stop:775 length:474 start_codon:yes stop_codon:yes gene_type:complete